MKAFIFDLDGVLVSTDKYHYEAWKKIADEEGIYFDEKINDRLRGVSRMASLEIILEKADKKYSEEEKIALATRKNDLYRDLLKNLTPSDRLEGVTETLEKLREKGYLLAVATNKIENVAKDLVNKIFPNIFLTTCGDDGKRNKKPASDCVFEIQKRLNVDDINEVVYIGDSEVDYMTAINSKATPIVLTYGYRTLEELKPFIKEDTLIANTPEDILKYL